MIKIFYHGSPTSDLKILEPRLDSRLGIEGIFVADEPFGPMMFALLPIRAHAIVSYTTKDGKFIQDKVVTPMINEEGWLYTLEAGDEIIAERKPDLFYHVPVAVKVIKTEKILKEDVLKLG